MKVLKKYLKWFGLGILGLILIGLFFPTWTPAIKSKNSVRVFEQVAINGAKHQLMIRGVDENNPIIIFVHGGPGYSEIPYVRKYQDILEEKFIVVHYDQRKTGKSYHFFEDYSNLSTELLTNDLIELTKYIRERFGEDKVLLAGHSFGSYIGMMAAAKAPENYIAYIGIGQVSNFRESDLDALEYCLNEATKAGAKDDIQRLEIIKEQFEHGDAILPRKYIEKYSGGSRLTDEHGDLNKGFLMNPEYNLLDIIRFKLGIKNNIVIVREILEEPLPSIVKRLEIPVYFHMGQYDYKTSAKAAKNYFDSIIAPEKEFILYQQSAHYPQFEEEKKFADWLIKKFSN